MRPSRHARLAALACALGLALALLACEIAVRLWNPDARVTPALLRERSLQYEATVFARHAIRPRATTVEMEGPISINEHGYRGPSFDRDKPLGSTRILIYGGSSVFDIYAPEGQDWPRRVERNLRARGNERLEVINAGVPGHAASDSVGRLFAEGHLFDPDYALIVNAWNDLKDFTRTEPLLRLRRAYPPDSDPRTSYRGALDRILCEVSALYNVARRDYLDATLEGGEEGRPVRGEPLPFSAVSASAVGQYRMSMATFVDVAQNAGAIPILMTQARLVHQTNTPTQQERIQYDYQRLSPPALLEAFDLADAVVRQVAAETGTRLIDASAVLSGRDSAFEDHVHLSASGSEALARLVADHFARWLEEDGLGGSAPETAQVAPATR